MDRNFFYPRFFIFFFYYSLRQNQQELMNWRLTGLSKAKLFLFIFWQLFFPLFLCCILVLLWIVSFQSVYETLLQRINFLVLKTAELPDIRDILTSVSGLTIPMDQQTFFTIDFQNDLFFTDILRGFAQTLVGLSGCCLILSLLPFTFFIHHLQSRRSKRNET